MSESKQFKWLRSVVAGLILISVYLVMWWVGAFLIDGFSNGFHFPTNNNKATQLTIFGVVMWSFAIATVAACCITKHFSASWWNKRPAVREKKLAHNRTEEHIRYLENKLENHLAEVEKQMGTQIASDIKEYVKSLHSAKTSLACGEAIKKFRLQLFQFLGFVLLCVVVSLFCR